MSSSLVPRQPLTLVDQRGEPTSADGANQRRLQPASDHVLDLQGRDTFGRIEKEEGRSYTSTTQAKAGDGRESCDVRQQGQHVGDLAKRCGQEAALVTRP